MKPHIHKKLALLPRWAWWFAFHYHLPIQGFRGVKLSTMLIKSLEYPNFMCQIVLDNLLRGSKVKVGRGCGQLWDTLDPVLSIDLYFSHRQNFQQIISSTYRKEQNGQGTSTEIPDCQVEGSNLPCDIPNTNAFPFADDNYYIHHSFE